MENTLKKMKTIDGAFGEGGGQVLRSSLTLSMITKTPIELINIRAKRSKPGLMRQHLTAIEAAKTICNAEVVGADLGAETIQFYPGEIQAGDYNFSIGTAGSTVLVCQTILLALAYAPEHSRVRFEGGTHNGLSPSLCFFEQSYLPVLRQMGLTCDLDVKRLGFYPAGGGEWQIAVAPFERWKSISFAASKKLSGLSSQRCKMTVLLNNYDVSIAEKEVKIALNYLDWEGVPYEIKKGQARGKGNTFQIHFQDDEKHLMFESFAQKKVVERDVALTATKHLKAFLDAEVAVEEYLADQLLLPMALAKGGEFTTTEPSDHTLTNIAVIEQMLPIQFQVEQLSKRQWNIKVLS